MTREEKIDLLLLLEERKRRQPAWKPQRFDPKRPDTPLPQGIAFDSEASIIGYGGAAGGGKSDFMIGSALMQHTRAIIYRKHYADFEKIEERFSDIAGRKAIKQTPRYEVRPEKKGGITANLIVLASLDHEESAKDKYQGRDYDLIGFDEVVQLKQSTVEYLMNWNRSVVPNQRCKVVMTFNPPRTAEGFWIIEYFAVWLDERHPLYGLVAYGEIMHRATIAREDEARGVYYWFREPQTITHHPSTGEPLRAPVKTVAITFIRATLDDNLHLRDTNYRDMIAQNSNAAEARALLHGEFSTDLEDLSENIAKPQHWRKVVSRYRELQSLGLLPQGRPDVVSIDAALGGDDWMNAQYAYLSNGSIVCPQQHKAQGKRLPTQEAQIDWLKGLPNILDARLYIIDCDGGYGQGVYEWLCAEMRAQCGRDDFVIAHRGAINSKWAMPSWDRSGMNGAWAAQTFQNDTAAAWCIAARSLEFTDTAIFDDVELQRQMLSRKYKVISPYLGIEPKDVFKKRLGRSPDEADALAYALLGVHCWLESFGRP